MTGKGRGRGFVDRKPGPGRPKGAKSKLPLQIRQMVEDALSEAGGVKYLVGQARAHPAAFLGLVSKLLPRDVNIIGKLDLAKLSDSELAAIARGEVAGSGDPGTA